MVWNSILEESLNLYLADIKQQILDIWAQASVFRWKQKTVSLLVKMNDQKLTCALSASLTFKWKSIWYENRGVRRWHKQKASCFEKNVNGIWQNQ